MVNDGAEVGVFGDERFLRDDIEEEGEVQDEYGDEFGERVLLEDGCQK